MNKKKICTLVISSVIFIGVVCIVGNSVSSFTSKDEIVNTFNLGSVDIEIDEGNWEDVGNAEFEKTYDKKVKIQNTGKSDSYIRVALIPRWVNEDGSPWMGDTSGVTLTLSSSLEKWTEKKSDNYYYYKEAVKPGDNTDELLSNIFIKVDGNLKDRYEGKTLIIDVKAEGVLATDGKDYITAWQ